LAASTAWLHCFGSGNFPTRERLAGALAQAGLLLNDWEDGLPPGPGVVFFTDETPALCSFLATVSRQGSEFVLALALDRSLLNSAAIWRLLQAGAADVLGWDSSEAAARAVVARFQRWDSVDRLLRSPVVEDNCIGTSRVWKTLLRQIIEACCFTDAPILILGESGTGKELIARLIHTLDQRPNKGDLIVLDCTTIVRELSGSEFFGHERGAFTSAEGSRDGVFARADGGTLFLDEVGELPLKLQAELLRVIQERTYKRVGGNSWQRTHFRLVCATNRDLLSASAKGQFRHDLYHRIAGWTCRLPPLRDRPQDILPLALHFMKQCRPDQDVIEMDDAVREYIQRRPYPGNVRDLKYTVARIMNRHAGAGPVTAGAIEPEERPAPEPQTQQWRDVSFEDVIERALAQGMSLKEIGKEAEAAAVRLAVQAENGNLQRAARRLGVTDRALQLRRAAGKALPPSPPDTAVSKS
jgi:transcriptional regulator with GAF, ATPase, and Fis domain